MHNCFVCRRWNGILPNASLLYKANTTTGDYHKQMNSQIFEKWAKEKLIPNLLKNIVVVIDITIPMVWLISLSHCANKQASKCLTKWKNNHGLAYWKENFIFPNMRKIEFLELFKSDSPAMKTYKFDSKLAEHGQLCIEAPSISLQDKCNRLCLGRYEGLDSLT